MTPPVAVTALQPPRRPQELRATVAFDHQCRPELECLRQRRPAGKLVSDFPRQFAVESQPDRHRDGDSYIDTTMTAGNTDYYAVEAKDPATILAMSSLATVTAPQPAAPTAFTATATRPECRPELERGDHGGLPVNWYLIFRGTSQSNDLSQPP